MNELSLQILIFLGLHLMVATTANSLVFRFFSDEVRDVMDWVMLASVFFAAEILMLLLAVGFLGFLTLNVVLVCVALLFVGSLVFLDGWGSWDRLRAVIARSASLWKDQAFLGIYGFLILYLLVELFNALVQFPWEYDTISYHLPFVVEWLQSGSLREVFNTVWGGPLGYYPSNHELLSLWLVLPFGNDYLVNILNFGFVFVLIITIFKILRELSVSSFLAWLSGALVMVMPIFLRQIGTSQVDVFMTLGLMMSWYFLLRTFKRHDGLLLLPFLLSFSLFLGTKYLSLVYAIPVGAVFLLFHRHWRAQYSLWWLISLVGVGVVGGAWYWRNLFLTGNPFFPADVRVGGVLFFEGYQNLSSRIQELSLWSRFEIDPGVLLVWIKTMIAEAGWQVYLVAGAYVLLVLEMIHKFLFRSMKRGEGRIFTVLLFLLPAYWYLYFIAPYTASMMEHNVRYAMPWLVLSMVVVAYSVDRLPHWRRFFTLGLIGVVWWEFLELVTSLRAGEQRFMDLVWVDRYLWVFWLMVGLIGLSIFFFEGWRTKRWWRHGIGVLVVVVTLVLGNYLVGIRTELRHEAWQLKYAFPLFKAYERLDELSGEDGVLVANTLNPLYYPLYGASLKRRVKYVNINDCLDCDYADFHERQQRVRSKPNYWLWRENLLELGVDYVMAGYSLRDGLEDLPPYEVDWAGWHPEQFEKVFDEGGVRLYRVLTP